MQIYYIQQPVNFSLYKITNNYSRNDKMCDFLKVKFISEREREREREKAMKRSKKINVDSTTVASTLCSKK